MQPITPKPYDLAQLYNPHIQLVIPRVTLELTRLLKDVTRIDDLGRVYEHLYQLIPHLDTKNFTMLRNQYLQLLLNHSSHLRTEQTQLALALASWHVEHAHGDYREAMSYYG